MEKRGGVKRRYYLKGFWQKRFKEVSKEEYIRAERNAGFRSKFGDNEVATAGFGNGNIQGRVRYYIEERK